MEMSARIGTVSLCAPMELQSQDGEVRKPCTPLVARVRIPDAAQGRHGVRSMEGLGGEPSGLDCQFLIR